MPNCVIQMPKREVGARSAEETVALKRLAIQVVAQLPDSERDALAVLEYAQTLVRSFLAHPEAC